MIQLRRWKVILVVLATLFGVVFTLPNVLPASGTKSWPAWVPQKRLNLGLDLQGGSYLLLEVDTAALKKEKLNNLIEDVRRDLQAANIPFTGLGRGRTASVSVHITDPAQVDAAYTVLNKLATAADRARRAGATSPSTAVPTGWSP